MDRKFISSLVQLVINSIQNTGVFIVKQVNKSLQGILSVKVTNPTEKVEVSGSVAVDQTKVEEQIKNLALAVRELKNPLSYIKKNDWNINDVENIREDLSYYGEENIGGQWRIRKVSVLKKVTSTRYATISNNRSMGSYRKAWENRDSLVYGYAVEILAS